MSLPEGYSRRLVGPNLFFKETGTVLDIPLKKNKDRLVALWENEVKRILPHLGWREIKLDYKIYNNGIRLAFVSPYDITNAACDVIDFTWASVCQYELEGNYKSIENAKSLLIPLIELEKNLKLRRIYQIAVDKGVNIFFEAGLVTIGSGKFSYQRQIEDIDIDRIPWEKIKDIPTVLITGTNGKTTTVRLTSYICQNAGKSVGYCSTDWVMINGKIIDKGDYSGPAGNRFVLTNPDVDVAVLEVARGGLLKRGIANTHVTAATVTNISVDHLGEDGVETLVDLAEAKSIVFSTVENNGHAIVNLDDTYITDRLDKIKGKKIFISQKLPFNKIESFLKQADYICYIKNDTFYLKTATEEYKIANFNEVPITINGFAKHNIENVLNSIVLAYELGCDIKDIAEAIKKFKNTDDENLGRANIFHKKGAVIIVDFAHNTAGIKAVLEMAQAYKGKAMSFMFGQTGDRLEMIPEIASVIASYSPKQVIIKEIKDYLRGAELGQVPQFISKSLCDSNYSQSNIVMVEDELAGMDYILNHLCKGEVYVLCCHEHVEESIAKIKSIS